MKQSSSDRVSGIGQEIDELLENKPYLLSSMSRTDHIANVRVTFGGRSIRRTSQSRTNHGLVCTAQAKLPSDGTSNSPSKEEMLKRIAKAKEYKGKPSAADEEKAMESFVNYAVKQAKEMEDSFLKAQDEAKAAAKADRQPPTQPTIQTASPEMLERMNRAKQYKADASSGPSPSAPTTHPPPPEPPSPPDSSADINASSDREFRQGSGTADEAANWLQVIATDSTASGLDTNLRAEEFTLAKEENKKQLGVEIMVAKGAITSNSAARRVADVDYGLAQQQSEAETQMANDELYANITTPSAPSYTQEELDAFQAEQEQLEQQQQGDKDQTNNTGAGEEHKPAVATWGVFPRPKNISKTYGGGRNLRPGQDLETPEEAEARNKRVTEALSAYKRNLGLDLDPAVEAEAQRLYDLGMKLFDNGQITAALQPFSEACDMVPVRHRLGGLAGLQKAICLDSMGRNDEAYTIYKSLKSHSAPGVSRTSRRMMFGFEAAKDLKVNTMDFRGADSQAWGKYFDRFNSSTWAMYKPASEEVAKEDEGQALIAGLVAASVVMVPLAFIVIKIVVK